MKLLKVTLSEKFLVSVCCEYNHVRTWSVTRFRGMISTQPGSTPVASFKILSLEEVEPCISYCAGNDCGKGILFISLPLRRNRCVQNCAYFRTVRRTRWWASIRSKSHARNIGTIRTPRVKRKKVNKFIKHICRKE